MADSVLTAGYQEYKPCAALKPYVECFWSSVQLTGNGPRQILPDGCIDIIFDRQLPEYEGGLVVGTMTRAHLYSGELPVTLVAVRFRPGGAHALLGVPAIELTDNRVPVGDILKGTMAQQIYQEVHANYGVGALERSLVRLLVDRHAGANRRLLHAVSLLENNVAVDDVAATIETSRQHLARLFRQHVGIAPKLFARISRLRKLAGMIESEVRFEWPMLAARLGYFDQAHMIADCKQLTGLTPTQLQQRGR